MSQSRSPRFDTVYAGAPAIARHTEPLKLDGVVSGAGAYEAPVVTASRPLHHRSFLLAITRPITA